MSDNYAEGSIDMSKNIPTPPTDRSCSEPGHGGQNAPAPSLMRFGWAPGSYASKCDDCGSSYVGWSKATRCKDCARAVATEFEPAPAPERDGESDAAFVERMESEHEEYVALVPAAANPEYARMVALARIGARATPAVADAGAVTFVEATEPGWYAVSHVTPRFCVYGKTEEKAREKADEAIRFYNVTRAALVLREPTR